MKEITGGLGFLIAVLNALTSVWALTMGYIESIWAVFTLVVFSIIIGMVSLTLLYPAKGKE